MSSGCAFTYPHNRQDLPLSSLLPSTTEPYTVREARIHVRHIRDLLKSLDPSDAFNGVDCNSLSFLSIFTEGDLGGVRGDGQWRGVLCKGKDTRWFGLQPWVSSPP